MAAAGPGLAHPASLATCRGLALEYPQLADAALSLSGQRPCRRQQPGPSRCGPAAAGSGLVPRLDRRSAARADDAAGPGRDGAAQGAQPLGGRLPAFGLAGHRLAVRCPGRVELSDGGREPRQSLAWPRSSSSGRPCPGPWSWMTWPQWRHRQVKTATWPGRKGGRRRVRRRPRLPAGRARPRRRRARAARRSPASRCHPRARTCCSCAAAARRPARATAPRRPVAESTRRSVTGPISSSTACAPASVGDALHRLTGFAVGLAGHGLGPLPSHGRLVLAVSHHGSLPGC